MEEIKKGTLFLLECWNCKNKFRLDFESSENSSVVHKKEFKVNDKSIFLTYYDCPSCGRRHFVQIDDDKSIQLFTKVKTDFVKLAIAKRKGKSISKKQSENFNKSRQDLSDYRTKLMKEYAGKVIVNEAGIETILEFSV